MALATRKNTTRTAVDAMYGKAANGVTSSSAGATCYRASTASSHPESTDLADAHRSPHAARAAPQERVGVPRSHGTETSRGSRRRSAALSWHWNTITIGAGLNSVVPGRLAAQADTRLGTPQ